MENAWITNRYDLWEEGEYNYPMAYSFRPNIVSYIHQDEEVRPAMLVVPGGGYAVCSPTEGEVVARRFYELGYQAFVLTYTTNYMQKAPLHMLPLQDISRAVRMIRKMEKEFHIHTNELSICGFSAGGHLCASLLTHYADVKDSNLKYKDISNRPDAGILSYPVITAVHTKAHEDSFDFLIGAEPVKPQATASAEEQNSYEEARKAYEEERDYMSLENQVTKQTPPCFLWQTITDELVPVENSILFAEALRAQGVKHSLHLYSHGHHGMSVADEDWATGKYSAPYPFEQTFVLMHKYDEGEFEKSETFDQLFGPLHGDEWTVAKEMTAGTKPDAEVASWPFLADTFLRGLFAHN